MIKTDFIIVGGGIVGMTTARELAQRGVKVVIFEQGKLGMEASWAAGGILSSMRPWAEHPASAALSSHGKLLYLDYVESLKNEVAIDSEYIRSGLMIIEESHAEKTKAWAKTARIEVEEANHSIFDMTFPEKSVLLPDIAQIRTPKLLKALQESLKQLSVSIYENTEITNVHVKDDQFSHVVFNGGKVYADSLIITAGAWSGSIVKEFNKHLAIKPIHGQMLCVKPKKQELKHMLLDDGYYLIPRKDGHVLIGSTMEDIGFKKMKTEEAKQELLDWACAVWSGLRHAEFKTHWSGLRPSTDDGKPIIGALPGYENIYLNTGHFRKGILQAPSSAILLADYLAGEKSFMDINEFALENKGRTLELT